MKYYLHSDGINPDTVRQMIEFVQDNEGELTIGINSSGGDVSAAAFLLDCLNANKDRITIIAVTAVFSAAFSLFYRFNGKKKITTGCRGMFHYSTQPITMAANGRPDGWYDENALDVLKSDRAGLDEFAGLFMTPSELKKFRKNWDVYFNTQRMREIFPDAEII